MVTVTLTAGQPEGPTNHTPLTDNVRATKRLHRFLRQNFRQTSYENIRASEVVDDAVESAVNISPDADADIAASICGAAISVRGLKHFFVYGEDGEILHSCP